METRATRSPSVNRKRRRGREERKPRNSIGVAATVTLAGAVLAAAISATTLVFDLWPSLKPDPKAKVGATLQSLTRDINVSRSDYLARVGRVAGDGQEPDELGNVYYIRAEIEGFKRSTLRLKWFTYNADNQTRLPGLRNNDREEPVFKPQAPINTQIAEVWVPTPSQAGEYFVRFELYSENVLLAFVDSKPFSSLGDLPE
jgi:hypothetical protein